MASYIPKKGNTFNYVTKKALGNGYIDEKSDADFEFFKNNFLDNLIIIVR